MRSNSEELRNRLGIECVVDVVRRGIRWFGHVERKGAKDWVSGCRNVKSGIGGTERKG